MNADRISFYKPKKDELGFRKELLLDEETMSYNKKWGGTIDFNISIWDIWYKNWIENPNQRFYAYLYDNKLKCFVGEVGYYYSINDKKYLIHLLVHAKYRNNGIGTDALNKLCEYALKNDIEELSDNIAIDNKSVNLFFKNGFNEVYRNEDCIFVTKKLI